MNEKDLYRQKRQAQMDEWKADLDKLKAKAQGSIADSKIKLNQHINLLESDIEEGEKKLSELAEASEDRWESIKDGVESAWGSLKSAFSDAASKFKD